MVLEVKHAGEPQTDEEKKEQELIYKALAPNYCVCNHRRDKHVNGEYECTFKAMQADAFSESGGGIQTFECQCKLFTSLEDSATVSYR